MTARQYLAGVLRKAAAKLDPQPPFRLVDFDHLPDTPEARAIYRRTGEFMREQNSALRAGGLKSKIGLRPRPRGPQHGNWT